MSSTPLRFLCASRNEFGGGGRPLTVTSEFGVAIRDLDAGGRALGEDLGAYRVVRCGDLVVNKLWARFGAYGVSQDDGVISPAYWVLRLDPSKVHARYVHHLLRSAPYRAEIWRRSKDLPPNGFDISWEQFRELEVPDVSLQEQRRIANFLDDRVLRIESIVAARRHQAALEDSAFDRLVLETVSGRGIDGDRRPSGLRWLGTVPASWPVLPVMSQFETVLGKMLDERQRTGEHPLPYLRNTNVQWDRVETEDLKVMDIAPSEYARCTLRAGDLLICEGGQPGRAAVWDGSIPTMAFQKALHRARSRGRSHPRWLLHCLRAAVAMNAFAGENGVTTIGHLTGEQLRAQRFPFPEPETQAHLVAELDLAMSRRDQAKAALGRSVALFGEYKQSLISAAVTGEFDVTTASGRTIPA